MIQTQPLSLRLVKLQALTLQLQLSSIRKFKMKSRKVSRTATIQSTTMIRVAIFGVNRVKTGSSTIKKTQRLTKKASLRFQTRLIPRLCR